MSIGVNFGDVVRPSASPDRLAFVDLASDPPRRFTAVEFDAEIDAVAAGLAASGLAPGSRIAILAGNRAEVLHAYFGAMRAGLVPVPVNHRLARDTIAYILQDASPAIVLVDHEHAPLVPAGRPVIHLDDDEFSRLRRPGRFVSVAPSADAPAKILYTSGSSGRPKGVALGHSGQFWAISHPLSVCTPLERIIVAAPYYHKNGLYNATTALAGGAVVVSLPRFDAAAYLRAIAEYRCTRLSGVPTMFALMARERELLSALDLTSVRTVSVGSAPLSMALAARIAEMFPGAVLSNGYGTTEAGPIVFGPHPGGLPRPAVSIGCPAPGVEWRLVGGADEGVLQLRTPALMQGYLNDPSLTAAKLMDGWYDTGDVVRRDADGFFYFVGRTDDMFVCGGENVFPSEVETLLERHPEVSQAIVVPAPDDIKGQIPIAFVVPKAGGSPTEAALRQFALEHGPAYSHPRAVVLKDALPLATTHKIDRRRLADEARQVAHRLGRTTAP